MMQMQDELNSIEEKVVLDKTISLKINNKICLAFESTTHLSISEAIQYTVDEDYPENKLYLDFYSHELGKEVLIKNYEFFLQNMEDLAGKTLSIYLDISIYRYVFLAIIEGELDKEFDYSNIIYRFESFQIPSEKNDVTIEVPKGATVFERGFVISGRVSKKAMIVNEWIEDGMHINAFGADGPGKQELDPSIMKRAKIVVDSLKQCRVIGEIQHALKQGMIKETDIHAEIGEILLRKKVGRENEEEITLFDSTGLAVQDIAAANVVYELAKQNNMGQRVKLL
jgi:hypothetical protein